MTVAGAVGFVLAVAVAVWLILRRDSWARDLYQLPDNAFGRAVVVVLGALLIVAAVWLAAEALVAG